MSTSDFEKGWAPYQELLPFNQVWQLVEQELEICKQDLQALLPSIVFSAGGRRMNSVLFTTRDFLVEIHIGSPTQQSDFVCIRTIGNYLVQRGFHEVKQDGADPITFETASVVLVHTLLSGTTSPFIHPASATVTHLQFVGSSRREWLASVLAAIPLSLVVESVR